MVSSMRPALSRRASSLPARSPRARLLGPFARTTSFSSDASCRGARPFDRTSAEDRDARVTSMTLTRPARSAFVRRMQRSPRGRLRGLVRSSPATSARLCRRASASIARLRPMGSLMRRSSARRVLRYPKDTNSFHRSACAGSAGEWSAFVDVCRPSDPRARSAYRSNPAASDLAVDRVFAGRSSSAHRGRPSCGRRVRGRGRFRVPGCIAACKRLRACESTTLLLPRPDDDKHLSSRRSCGGVWRSPPCRQRFSQEVMIRPELKA
jgi:hypothetical protein